MAEALSRTASALLAIALMTGCGDDARELRWRLRFEDATQADRVRIVEASILMDGCAGTEVWAASFPLAGPLPDAPPALPKGTFGFMVTTIDAECMRFATGCTEIDLPREDGSEVIVELSPRTEMPLCASVICNEGVCEIPDGGISECPSLTADCNGDPLDGCEGRLDTLDSCGACDTECRLPHATESCEAGVCAIAACEDDWADCDGSDANGCEESLASVDNCGACGTVCNLPHAAETCDDVRCELVVCHTGWADCDGSPANGCETDLRDPANCGACDMACDAATPLCDWSRDAATCVAACPTAKTACDMSCIDTATDPENCGGCGMVCSFDHGIAACTASACSLSACEPRFSDCDAMAATGCETAVNTLTDCGGCATSCVVTGAFTSCAAGDCAIDECLGEFDDCNGEVSDGCEADLASALTCGACDMSCDLRSPICGVGSDGARLCVESCAEPAETRCGDRCQDTDHELENCGGCGNLCTVPNGTPRCTGGECLVATCDENRGDCDGLGANGCETDLLTSLDHCGACGALCAGPDAQCIGGECMTGCPAGMGNCDGDGSTGCETPLNTASDCGACGRACSPAHGTGDCSSGTCTITSCEGGFEDCDRSAANGCESSVSSDPDNCGSCGMQCRPPRCCMGMCC